MLELTMNTKLIHIARHTARGGTIHRLKPTIFWFGAKGPWYCPASPALPCSALPCPALATTVAVMFGYWCSWQVQHVRVTCWCR